MNPVTVAFRSRLAGMGYTVLPARPVGAVPMNRLSVTLNIPEFNSSSNSAERLADTMCDSINFHHIRAGGVVFAEEVDVQPDRCTVIFGTVAADFLGARLPPRLGRCR